MLVLNSDREAADGQRHVTVGSVYSTYSQTFMLALAYGIMRWTYWFMQLNLRLHLLCALDVPHDDHCALPSISTSIFLSVSSATSIICNLDARNYMLSQLRQLRTCCWLLTCMGF